jgi:adenylate kinase family enzyme
MKFYETTMDEYITSSERYNLHPELHELFIECFPEKLNDFENIIVYGPTGSGKYTQVLKILKKYSPSHLKHEKKIQVQSEKKSYILKISDIHYEVDMSFLGCNSKNVWNDIFCQIVDIISVKQEKMGIILCKNFHMIHSELLEIFYSYIQQYTGSKIKIKFIILTEQISFIPNNIIRCCVTIPIKKPSSERFKELIKINIENPREHSEFQKRINSYKWNITDKTSKIMETIDTNTLINIKEIQSFSLLQDSTDIPNDIFNIVCDKIITEIEPIKNICLIKLRDSLYDIFIYNLDLIECIWYILSYFIRSGKLSMEDISVILHKTYSFLKYYNNNYRPIYHLENIILSIISCLHKYG